MSDQKAEEGWVGPNEREFREEFIQHWDGRITDALKARRAYASGRAERVEGEGHAGWYVVKVENLETQLIIHANAINETGLKAGDEVQCIHDPKNSSVWSVEKVSGMTDTDKEVEEAYG